MDARSFIRPIIAGLIGIGLIVLIIVLIVKAFSGGNSGTKPINLVSYAGTDATAQLYISGPIVSDQEHRAVRITVGSGQTEIDIIQGYQDNIIHTKTYANNPSSYAVFLKALGHLNFTQGNSDPAQQDERGFCAQADRFIYSFATANGNLFRYWSTSCGEGTFGGDRAGVQQLFERQIPTSDFEQLTGDIPLS